MGVKELYTEKYKTQMKGTEEDTNNCKFILCSYISITKNPTYQSDLQIQCNPYQNSKGIFHKKKTLKFIWNHKRCQRAI